MFCGRYLLLPTGRTTAWLTCSLGTVSPTPDLEWHTSPVLLALFREEYVTEVRIEGLQVLSVSLFFSVSVCLSVCLSLSLLSSSLSLSLSLFLSLSVNNTTSFLHCFYFFPQHRHLTALVSVAIQGCLLFATVPVDSFFLPSLCWLLHMVRKMSLNFAI